MRCPNCSFEIQGTPRLCPQCSDTLPAPEAWETEMDARPWVRLGAVGGLSAGVILVASQWQGALGVGVGGLLFALALVSLIVSRGGTRWDNLPTMQKIIVGMGAGAVVGFALLSLIWALIPSLLPLLARIPGGPSGSYSSRGSRGRNRESGSRDAHQEKLCPVCGMSLLPRESVCSFCTAAALTRRQADGSR